MWYIGKSMDRWPSKHKTMWDTKAISSLIDNSSNINWSWYNLSSIFWTVLLNLIPWSLCCHFYSFLELFWSVNIRVVNPFLFSDFVMVCANEILSKIECFNFLCWKSTGENIKMIPIIKVRITRRNQCWQGTGYYSIANS